MAFTHLHVHTEYSLLDGAARIKDLVKTAKEMGMDSLAITDHGVMFGVIDFYKECKAAGIKPVIGCEVYTAARTMDDKDADKDKHHGHLILLAENDEGYHNIVKIVSESYTRGFYYKPRVDKDLLRQYSSGIIALSGCLAGRTQRELMNGNYSGAREEAEALLEIFGKGNFFLEVQDQGLEEEARILPDLKKLSEELDIPMVATNDVHYVKREDAETHDVLLCIQTGSLVSDENRMSFPNDQFYLKSEREMRTLFAGVKDACDNTTIIAERCNVDFTFGELHLPEFQVPEGFTKSDYLRHLCEEGLEKRYGKYLHAGQTAVADENSPYTVEHLRQRLEYELGTIIQMGYVEYFLIVWDFINYAKNNGIMVGPGRGSGAGSIVAYVLEITDIDPLKYNLIFERFLNPERVSMPDIDIDFCYERRHEVIEYVIAKYGVENVSQIITFGKMKAKAAVRDVGRVLGVSYADTDAIAKAIPFGTKMTIKRALELNPDLKKRYDEDSVTRKVLDVSMAIEGMPRHASTHAAGVVISKKPIKEYVPLYSSEKGVSTQFTMTTIEKLGLLKMDFLGLRTLTVIRDALAMIEENHGVKIDFSRMEYDDPNVYAMISKGNTDGIFQLESGGMTQFMKNLQPDCLEDILAGSALYRPGPMSSIPTYIENKRHPDKIKYIDKSLEPVLSVTYGCLVYQEQVMQIVRDLAGYTYGRSDLIRRAMSKKDMAEMLREKQYFIYGKDDENGNIEVMGAKRNGVPEKAAEEIFNQMVAFAEYAFNKSHAAAYAVVGYETAYLKCYYPVEFMAALMTSVIGNAAQISRYIRNCREMGIEVLPPDVNEGFGKFTVKDSKIQFGLEGVKNTGEGVIREIVRAREEKGVPKDFAQFINNLNIREINKKAIESLIKAGAFDCMNDNRAQLLAVYEKFIESAQNSSRKNIEGQMSLFQLNTAEMEEVASVELPDVRDFSKEVKAAIEKEMLGVYLTWNPLDEFADKIKEISTVTSMQLSSLDENLDVQDGKEVYIAGIIDHKKEMITKSNKRMAFLELEDLYGTVELIVFPNVFEKYGSLTDEDKIVAVSGKLSFKEDEDPKLIVDAILDIRTVELSDLKKAGNGRNGRSERYADSGNGDYRSGGQNGVPSNTNSRGSESLVKIRIPEDIEPKEGLEAVKEVLLNYPGEEPVIIYTAADGKSFRTRPGLWVKPSMAFQDEIISIVGRENLKV